MPRVSLLNSPICPNPGTFTFSDPISPREAREFIEGATLESFIGHEGTAQALGTLLGQPVPVTRERCRLASGESAIVLVLARRLEEGRVLTEAELAAVGYTLHVLRRVA